MISPSSIPRSTTPEKAMKLLLATALLFSAAAHAETTVTVQKFAFTPKEITVAPGTKVVWINKDETPHTVSSNDKSFLSKALDTDDKYEFTFANPGDFSYFC